MNVAEAIIKWYEQYKRDLPWRNTNDPYTIWVSEVILQQTRIDQGLAYFHRFTSQFPTVNALAIASEETVLKCWQGLGYYSRARNMHFSAKYIMNELGGVFPNNFLDLKKLKGVGDYTAAAIASFAYKQSVPLVDGNVYRFLSRLYAERTPIDTAKGKKLFFCLAEHLIQNQQPDVFNQAIMEFGSLQCKPGLPDCSVCILQSNCLAFESKLVTALPVKSKQLKKKDRFLNYFLITDGEDTFVKRREGKGIWQGLFGLPLIETPKTFTIKKLSSLPQWALFFDGTKPEIEKNGERVKHVLSHQNLYVDFYFVNMDVLPDLEGEYQKIPMAEIDKYPVPRLIERFFEKALS